MKRKIYVILLITAYLLFSMLLTNISFAMESAIETNVIKIGFDPIADPNSFRPGQINQNDITVVAEKSNKILGTITTVGVVVSVITIIILGIKYMLGSVEEKAEYKKVMMPYLVGSILLFGAATIVKVIANLVKF